MAGSAICAESTSVRLRLSVAVHTCSRCRETGMVEGGVSPIGWVVAGLALGSILSVVFIILFMAGVTVFWRAFEYIIHMAFLAGDTGMFAFQFERRKIMVEMGRRPAFGGVAGLAFCAIGEVMRVILPVA